MNRPALLALLALTPSASAQCLADRWADPVASVPSIHIFPAATHVDGRAFVASMEGPDRVAAIRVARFDPSSGTYRFESLLAPAAWTEPRSSVACLSAQGSTVAAQRDVPFGSPAVVEVFERGPGGWTHRAVPLAGLGATPHLEVGQRCALDGDTILVADGTDTAWPFPPFEVQVLERGPGGAWGQTQNVVFPGTRVGWHEYPVTIDLDGDVGVLAMGGGMQPAGSALVVERSAAGSWSWTASLAPSGPDFVAVEQTPGSVAVSGDLIAVQRYQALGRGELHTTLYRRAAPGSWGPVQTIVTADPAAPAAGSAQLLAGVRFHGTTLVVQCGTVVDLYEPGPGGAHVPTRRITGLGHLQAIDDEVLLGLERRPGVVEPRSMRRAGAGARPRNTWCPDRAEITCNGTSPVSLTWLQLDPGAPLLDARVELHGAEPGGTGLLVVSASADLRPTTAGTLCLGTTGLLSVSAPRPVDPIGRASFPLTAPALAPFAGTTLHAQALTLGTRRVLSASARVAQ